MTTLLYLDAVVAAFPDNSAQLIQPIDIRNQIVSTLSGKGFLEETENVALPIVDGVYIQINPLLTAPVSTNSLWSFDGNNQAHASYSALSAVTVPAGYKKLTNMVSVLELTKAAGGSDNFLVSYSKNGVTFGQPESVEFAAAGIQTLTLLLAFFGDISIETDTYGVQIQGDGTGSDLTLGYFTQQLSDSILLTDPDA